MSGKRSPYGTISRGSSSRRRRRRNDTLRLVLSVLLICVLLMVVGFLGVNALRGESDDGKPGGNDVVNGQPDETDGASGNESESTEAQTQESTEPAESTEPTEPPYVPEVVTQPHTIWLDAGHGGTDWGSAEWVRDENGNVLDANGNIVTVESGEGEWVVREKHDTLELTLAIQKALEERGVTVIMTRTDDTYLHRWDRAALANESDAECFVSIHRNYLEDLSKCGIEAWLVNPITLEENPVKAKDTELTQFIFDELAEEETNGILGMFRTESKDKDNSVNLRTTMPSLILEMGYMSNALDNELFHANIEEYATAIADGIVKWLKTQE